MCRCRQGVLSVARYGPAFCRALLPLSSIDSDSSPAMLQCRTLRLTSAWIKSLMHWRAFCQKQNFVSVNLCINTDIGKMTRGLSTLSYLFGVYICHVVNKKSAGLLWWELVRCCWSWYNTPWPRHQVCSLQRFLPTLSTSSGLIGFWRVFNGLLMLIHFVFRRAFLPGG